MFRRLVNLSRLNSSFRRFSSSVPQTKAPEAENAALTTITFKERAREGVSALVFVGAGAAAVGFAYLTFKTLVPTKLGPNSVFNSAFEKVRNHSEVVGRLGSPVKGYGHDFGSTRTGRRNQIDHDEYLDDDGIWRTRVKFNLEGPNGKAICYAEKSASDDGPDGFSYIILEVPMRGRKEAIALIDNRKELTREELQDKVTKRLGASGITILGHTTCAWTKRQLEELGEFSDRVKVLYCDKPENHEECIKAQLKGYPTWRYKDQNVPGGFQTLEQLQQLARML